MRAELPLDSMSTIEKLQVLESVWESLSDPSELPVPDWHREVLAERKRPLETGEATVFSWSDAKRRLSELGNAD